MTIDQYARCVAEIISIIKKRYTNMGAIEAHDMATSIMSKVINVLNLEQE